MTPPSNGVGAPRQLRVRPDAARMADMAPKNPWPDLAAVATGVGLGAAVALPLSQATWKSVVATGGLATLLGNVTAMAGTYLLLIMVLLASRLPGLERAIGQDFLIRWHRRLSPAPLVLLGAHALFTTLGYAEAGRVGFLSESGSLITTMSWIFAAVVAYAMLVAIALVSIRAVRRQFHYDTWWVIHLYTYLALAFSIPHEVIDGTSFVGYPAVQTLWILLWVATAGTVIVYRIGLPVARSLHHRMEIASITPAGPGAYSMVIRGHDLQSLSVAGGQYFAWRFLVRGLWWHAHPFTVSALPAPPHLRVTFKVTGDATRHISRLRPGTRLAVEGPYGAFTDQARTRRKVALLGAGIGVTPLRALLEDVPVGVDVVVVQRASRWEDMLLHDEMVELVDRLGGRMVPLVGSRRKHRLDDPRYLHRVVPDVATRDLYICGPEQFSAGVIAAARRLGCAADAIHCELFEL